MKKVIATVLLLFLSTSIIGCGKQNTSVTTTAITETQNKIPEPYTLMLKQLDSNDLNMVQKYADLVISDFKDTPYVYNANLVKSIVNLSKMNIVRIKSKYIVNGSDKIGSLNSKEDIDRLQGYIKELQAEFKSYQSVYNETTQYLLDHFSDKDNIKLEFPTIPSDMGFHNYSALEFFSNVGYPIPTDSEMVAGDRQNGIAWVSLMTKDVSSSSKFFPDYFYYLSVYAEDNVMKKKLLGKIIELTESDKYSEIRIKAQDDLSKLN